MGGKLPGDLTPPRNLLPYPQRVSLGVRARPAKPLLSLPLRRASLRLSVRTRCRGGPWQTPALPPHQRPPLRCPNQVRCHRRQAPPCSRRLNHVFLGWGSPLKPEARPGHRRPQPQIRSRKHRRPWPVRGPAQLRPQARPERRPPGNPLPGSPSLQPAAARHNRPPCLPPPP
jgi:hypothetical protein